MSGINEARGAAAAEVCNRHEEHRCREICACCQSKADAVIIAFLDGFTGEAPGCEVGFLDSQHVLQRIAAAVRESGK